MDVETKAKLEQEALPCKADWLMGDGMSYTGTIIARGPDYIEVQTEQGDTYRIADADLADVTFV